MSNIYELLNKLFFINFKFPDDWSLFSPKANTSKAKRDKSKGTLVDVTEQYEESEDDITCGICEGWDPPIHSEPDQQDQENNTKAKKKDSTYNVGWVGCDCGRWYHKQCTNLKRFTAAFSCKSVKMKCQKKWIPIAREYILYLQNETTVAKKK